MYYKSLFSSSAASSFVWNFPMNQKKPKENNMAAIPANPKKPPMRVLNEPIQK